MNERIKEYVFKLFENVPPTSRVNEAKEELLAGCIDKYYDLTNSGKTEEDAYSEVIAGIGDVNELLSTIVDVGKKPDLNKPFEFKTSYEPNRPFETNNPFETKPHESDRIDPMLINDLKKKRAAFTSAGVFLFIFGFSLSFLLNRFGLGDMGIFVMLVLWAIAVFLIIYGFSSTKVQIANEISMDYVPKRRGLRASITSTMWCITVVIYLGISFATNRWYITWLIFIFATVVQMVINLYFSAPRFRRAHLNSIIWTSCTFLYLFISMATNRWDITWIFFLIAVCVQQIINLYLTWRDSV